MLWWRNKRNKNGRRLSKIFCNCNIQIFLLYPLYHSMKAIHSVLMIRSHVLMTSGNYLRFCEPEKVLSPQCYASCLKTLMKAKRNYLQSVMTTICISSQVSIITCHYITKGQESWWHQKQSEIELPTFLYLKPNSLLNLVLELIWVYVSISENLGCLVDSPATF